MRGHGTSQRHRVILQRGFRHAKGDCIRRVTGTAIQGLEDTVFQRRLGRLQSPRPEHGLGDGELLANIKAEHGCN